MLEKRSISLSGHRTSVALEPEYWAVVERMAAERGQSVAALVAAVDRTRGPRNLASAIRVAVLKALDERGKPA
nr:ribbon-helix-helix domain-containing protein [Chthonobacter albigriseus]